MDGNGLDLTHIEHLVAHWRERAEQIREEAVPSPARADVYDICAAQLADALAAVHADHGGHPDSPDAAALSFFTEEAETSAAPSRESHFPRAGEEVESA